MSQGFHPGTESWVVFVFSLFHFSLLFWSAGGEREEWKEVEFAARVVEVA